VNYFAVLHNAQQAHACITAMYQTLKPWLVAGHKFELQVKPEKRNSEQNALLHALLTDIAREREWGGKKWDVDDWKRLLTAAWLRARKEAAIFVPALDGQGFDILYRRTSQLSKGECSELIEFIQAWSAEHAETAS
jgi:hypothetical protein